MPLHRLRRGRSRFQNQMDLLMAEIQIEQLLFARDLQGASGLHILQPRKVLD